MKNALKHVYSTTLILGLAAAPIAMFATPVLAHGPGGMSGMHGDFGGESSAHMSVSGRTHTNGPNATDRDFGVIHARSRMSAKGLKHSKALLHAHRVIDSDHDADDPLLPLDDSLQGSPGSAMRSKVSPVRASGLARRPMQVEPQLARYKTRTLGDLLFKSAPDFIASITDILDGRDL
jgi:hypothetical protein